MKSVATNFSGIADDFLADDNPPSQASAALGDFLVAGTIFFRGPESFFSYAKIMQRYE